MDRDPVISIFFISIVISPKGPHYLRWNRSRSRGKVVLQLQTRLSSFSELVDKHLGGLFPEHSESWPDCTVPVCWPPHINDNRQFGTLGIKIVWESLFGRKRCWKCSSYRYDQDCHDFIELEWKRDLFTTYSYRRGA